MLIHARDSILLAIDFQRTFLDKIEPALADALSRRARFLIGVARWLRIPVFATVEEGLYPAVTPALGGALDNVAIVRKTTYNAARDRDLMNALASTGRRVVVLIGFETDVCIAQSAFGLQSEEYRVAVVSDAVRSSADGHAHGLERMRTAGVVITSVRSVYYEWMADVQKERAFRLECRDLYADGMVDY
jgi:nicotinamidase-related amidase